MNAYSRFSKCGLSGAIIASGHTQDPLDKRALGPLIRPAIRRKLLCQAAFQIGVGARDLRVLDQVMRISMIGLATMPGTAVLPTC